jgi:hypothetical protein
MLLIVVWHLASAAATALATPSEVLTTVAVAEAEVVPPTRSEVPLRTDRVLRSRATD